MDIINILLEYSLMRSHMIEAKFLIDRAKKIDDWLDVEAELKRNRQYWEESVMKLNEQLKIKK